MGIPEWEMRFSQARLMWLLSGGFR